MNINDNRSRINVVTSILLGTALGDSLGLPAENLSSERIQKRWPGLWKHRFFFGRGMVSDDTEHTVFVAQSLAEGTRDVPEFQNRLAWKLRWWLLCVPAGIGFATLRAVVKLWVGFPPSQSGVFSAGNGPAMRSAVLGVVFAQDDKKLRAFVHASTRLTHRDPRAEVAALAVALTAAWDASRSRSEVPVGDIGKLWLSAGQDPQWSALIYQILQAHSEGKTVSEVAECLGLKRGVTGYAYHTVPVALYAWLRHYGDFRTGLEAVIRCGGDTDSVGAITGALLAIQSPIPEEWLAGIQDYPISRSYLEKLGEAVEQKTIQVPPFAWSLLPLRNAGFFLVILGHLVIRLIR